MCYGCRVTCDDCKPKFVHCPQCGWRNLLFLEKCVKCETTLTQEAKDEAIAQWHEKHIRNA